MHLPSVQRTLVKTLIDKFGIGPKVTVIVHGGPDMRNMPSRVVVQTINKDCDKPVKEAIENFRRKYREGIEQGYVHLPKALDPQTRRNTVQQALRRFDTAYHEIRRVIGEFGRAANDMDTAATICDDDRAAKLFQDGDEKAARRAAAALEHAARVIADLTGDAQAVSTRIRATAEATSQK